MCREKSSPQMTLISLITLISTDLFPISVISVFRCQGFRSPFGKVWVTPTH